jgi:hypothetical protein
MKRTINGKTFPILMLLISMGVQACSTGTSGLEPYLRKKVTWKLTSLDKEVPVNIYFLGGDTGPDGSEVIVYMKNGAWDRIGQETDFSILHDYIQKKFIVITVDFGTDKQAVSPGFDKDLYELFKAVYGFRTPGIQMFLSAGRIQGCNQPGVLGDRQTCRLRYPGLYHEII